MVAGSFFITFLSVSVAALGNVAAYKIVAVLGDPGLFNEYSTGRRFLTFFLPIILFGAGVGLPLRISIRPNVSESLRILYLQLSVAAAIVLSVLLALWVAPASTTAGLIPGLGRGELTAVVLMTLAFNGTSMIYAYHRGFQEFRESAVLVVLANGIFPAIAALFIARGAAFSFYVWAALSLGLTAWALRRLPSLTRGSVSQPWSLVRSCFGRIPGDLSYAALFLVPVVQMQSMDDPIRQSVFNYYFVFLGVIIAAASPIGVVLLPLVGARVASGGAGAARQIFFATLALSALIGAAVFVVLRFLPSMLVEVFMSPQYVSQASILEDLAPGAAGVALFVFLKSVVDGRGETPITAVLSVAALAVYFGLRYLTQASVEISIIWSTNGSLGFLGLATVLTATVLFHEREKG